MTLAVVASRALSGLDAPEVAVEVHLANGLPAFNIVGLPDTEVKESRDRVRAAILTSGFEFPARKITVNLAPADLPKDSGRFDLPIAIGILLASGQVQNPDISRYEFAGELALSGAVRPVRGALAMACQCHAARRAFVLPAASAAEAAVVAEAQIYGVRSLLEACAFLNGLQTLQPSVPADGGAWPNYPDLQDVKGQSAARGALEIAAAGGHSLLLMGPPGTGKSMLAARLPGLLPRLSEQEALESAALLSLGSQGFLASNWRLRPFRAPHHTASAVALVGGGSDPRPGEISLAHHGVLFLDELPEFDRRVLEVLREPMESGVIHISRAARQASFPARFQLVAAMNPCPCGYHGHPSGRCQCTPEQVGRYRGKISGPLLDRIDLHIEVPALTAAELQSASPGESSEQVRLRVHAARTCQLGRQGGLNSALQGAELERHCEASADALAVLGKALQQLGLSARAYHRILRVSRTIADLQGEAKIGRSHVLQAIQLRRVMQGNA
ncbi:YifB family Mg chelatase-like AAA ATPase [Chromobacterium subtsugae]|uniref:YifB family Mg chelatase-like AAA ATPase n=2 Tax=Chromobacterium subtsugae TaxID=251747 RepID=A0ABS7FFV8_9NEIS|nr:MULTISPECIES: YifB family Mg chelatase-like AAA ATPase [Chromobacterium]KUM04010.1 ATP-dependent protease [Chromobacterium subtsugae]KZE86470.1 ATP-dependent protease [Chromobacterium sp. F49]MBW7567738.1 YifB family Mg chelatase-like AAA ATPase [Chromobacterium subtsugae]MBW8288964.1 YifB family Mg chelatase-like AAA ATPase [Chromobacterium subtsugae]WSE91243.1 YifB family Mg chelatase-like AAA ATPase [Chromobacterium subtsugae]